MNTVANRAAGGAVAAISKLKQGLANVSGSLPVAGGDPILRLMKDGIWVYGQENIEVEEGSEWAVNIFSIRHGFVSWTRYSDKDKNDKRKDELVGERLVPFTEPQPSRADLPNTGWDWTEEVSVNLQCLTGEDTGTTIVYKPTSVGGIAAMRKLIDAVMAQLDRDENHPIPVVTMEQDSYPHKRYGKTYVPILNIVKWVAADTPDDVAEQGDDDGAVFDRGQAGQRIAEEAPQQQASRGRTRRASTVQQPEQPATAPAAQGGDGSGGVVRRRRTLA